MDDETSVSVVIRLTGLPEFRLFLWELRMLVDEMRVAQDDRYVARLDRAISRFGHDDEMVH